MSSNLECFAVMLTLKLLNYIKFCMLIGTCIEKGQFSLKFMQ